MLHIFGKFMILKLKSSRLSYILVLSWPLSSNSRYKSKNDADEAVSVMSLTSSSGGYINGRNSANLELLIDKTSSIYLYVKLKALVSWIFLSFTSFWRNSDSYEYTNKSARRGALPKRTYCFVIEKKKIYDNAIVLSYIINVLQPSTNMYFWSRIDNNKSRIT